MEASSIADLVVVELDSSAVVPLLLEVSDAAYVGEGEDEVGEDEELSLQ